MRPSDIVISTGEGPIVILLILSYRRPTAGEPCGWESRLAAKALSPKPTPNGALRSIPPSWFPDLPNSTGPGRTPRSKYPIRRLPLAVGIKRSTARMTRMARLMRGANRDTTPDRTTRITWMGRLKRGRILLSLSRTARLPTSGWITGPSLLGKLTLLTSLGSMEKLTGKYRQEGMYRPTVMDTHNRLGRRVFLTGRQRFSGCQG